MGTAIAGARRGVAGTAVIAGAGKLLWSTHQLMDWMFRPDIDAGHIKSPLDIADVWPSSYSANTNEILWAAKFAARMPWIACVIRLP